MDRNEYKQMAGVLERFVAGTSTPWEFDDCFFGKTYADPFLLSIQRRAIRTWVEFPPPGNADTSPESVAVLKELAVELRSRI